MYKFFVFDETVSEYVGKESARVLPSIVYFQHVDNRNRWLPLCEQLEWGVSSCSKQ